MHLNFDVCDKVTFLTGSRAIVEQLSTTRALVPFCDEVIVFLNDVSRELLGNRNTKAYSDVVTFAFWIRKANVMNMKREFEKREGIYLGKGTVFHIAPSNVPVNFAYSLVTGLITGNVNIVRVPSKDFEQVNMITNAFNKVIEMHEKMTSYVICVRYDRDKEINDFFSSIADMRVIWGGDNTIAEIRKSPLPARSGEITFADRYSIAVIDSDLYMAISDKKRIAEDFYNDTFLTDQNACTSPRLVVWTGNRIEEAKEKFWSEEHNLVQKKYKFQSIQGVNKLTWTCLAAVSESGIKVVKHVDNLIVRVSVSQLTDSLMDSRGNSGFFYEYDCEDIRELIPIVDDKRCQTVGYIGDSEIFMPLIKSGVKGIDRIVPVGKTMDFSFVWDGYDLADELTRRVTLSGLI